MGSSDLTRSEAALQELADKNMSPD